MIDDLDKTIEGLLKSGLSSTLVEQVAISFAPPDADFLNHIPSLPAVDIFLYDVRENRELRTNELVFDRQPDGSVQRSLPPARLDCSYLITAWPSDSSTGPATDEHHLLSLVIMVLLRFPVIPIPMLVGRLRNQHVPPPISMLHSGRLQSPAEFWQAIGGKPKAALNYTVTISVPVEVPVETEPPVLHSEFTIDLRERRQG